MTMSTNFDLSNLRTHFRTLNGMREKTGHKMPGVRFWNDIPAEVLVAATALMQSEESESESEES